MPKSGVTASISTKDRYFSTLPLAIAGVLAQTVLPEKFYLFDDGEHKDIRGITPYNNLLRLLSYKGVDWEVVWAPRLGQVRNHQDALDRAKTEFVWRLDDDNIPEPRTLETLLEVAKDPSVGAVGGLVLFPVGMSPRPPGLTSRMEDIFHPMGNLQWHTWDGPNEEVDHLYSTFLYRMEAGRKAGGYPKDLSPIGHHEETTFSYSIKRAGYKLLVTPKATTWHLRDDQGGIRAYKDANLWAEDSRKFLGRLKDWGVTLRRFEVAVLDNGIGDHIVFKKVVLPELRKKHAGKHLVVAACYPEVFAMEKDLTLVSIADAKAAFGNIDKWNVYAWAASNGWKGPLEGAFRKIYGL